MSSPALQQLNLFKEQRIQDLQLAYKYATDAYSTGKIPALNEVPTNVFLTAASTLLLAQLVLLCLTRNGRKAVFDTIDTIVATILIIILIVVVLGLPVGAAYLFFKGAVFVSSALLHAFPQLQELFDSMLTMIK